MSASAGRPPGARRALGLAVPATLLALTLTAGAHPDFAAWLDALRRDAAARGISPATLASALAGLAPLPPVLELERRQPEFTMTFEEYLARVVPPPRVEQGKQHLREHQALLDEIGRRYGVAPPVIVALWGVESSYGQNPGSFPVIGALATLAYQGRRSAYFRGELLNALRIVDAGHVTARAMRGSWAGAMGQSQFMPSSFLDAAVDHDGDGRRDIWSSRPDIFASIANYLRRAGWRQAEPWGHAVRLPAGLDGTLTTPGLRRSLAGWRQLGFRRADGAELPESEAIASPALPAGAAGPVFLLGHNGEVLMRWNRSLFFVLAVGTLVDRLQEG